ncbi:unnamed protein product, partial [Brassica napus]
KCDTWCELQNPVNHRVFERKLRPKPSGRGHACLGVTNRRPHPLEDMGRKLISVFDVPSKKLLMTQSPQRDPSLEKALSDGPGPSSLERNARKGESPVVPGPCRTMRRCLRVGLFGNAAPIGR